MQLPLDPYDWPLVCLKVQSRYFVNLRLFFGLQWVAVCCLETTSFITRAFREQGGIVLNDIDDLGGIAMDHHTATCHFLILLRCRGLKEAAYKASHAAQAMTWLGLWFNTIEMSVTIPLEKLMDTLRLVEESQHSPASGSHWQVATHSSVLPVCQAFP